jgi:hypothetical protein
MSGQTRCILCHSVRLIALFALALASLTLVGGAAAGTSRAHVTVSVASGIVRPGDRVVARITGAVPERPLALFLQAYPLVGTRPHRVGRVRPNANGRAQLVFRLPRLAADVYRPWLRLGRTFVVGRGRLSVAALPPTGFGPPGAPGCAPASPRNKQPTSSGLSEVFGTSAGTQFWALPFATLEGGSAAALSGVVGNGDTKIVFKMTSGVPQTFYAVAPDSTRVAPAWMEAHGSSSWNRPGAEWGAGFAFDQPGCWRIHAGAAPHSGDIWLAIMS